MSGGSWDYFYSRLEGVANRLIGDRSASEHELRAALGRWLLKASEALHAIEWVDSCDYAPGDERQPIIDVFGKDAKQLEASELAAQIEELRTKINALV